MYVYMFIYLILICLYKYVYICCLIKGKDKIIFELKNKGN